MTAQLLRQPGGFEGFGMVRNRGSGRSSRLGTSMSSPSSVVTSMPLIRARAESARPSTGSSPTSIGLLELVPEAIRSLAPVLHAMTLERRPGLGDGAFPGHRLGSRCALDVSVEARPTASSPSVQARRPADGLHVLLRHRPRSISLSPRPHCQGRREYQPFSTGFALPPLMVGPRGARCSERRA